MRTEILKQDEPVDGAEPDDNRDRQKRRSKRFGIEVVEAELRHGIKPSFDPDDPLDRLLSAALRRRIRQATEKNAGELVT